MTDYFLFYERCFLGFEVELVHMLLLKAHDTDNGKDEYQWVEGTL